MEVKSLFTMVDESKEELVRLHQELVRIESVNTGEPDSGKETEVCKLLEDKFSAEGIQNETLESAPGRGNFIANWGGDGSPSLLFMSHTDVVPVEDESTWAHPPFSGEIIDGSVWGRGSDDCKSITATGTMAIFLLKRAGVALKGNLRLLAAADEESGGFYGIQWLAANHPEKIRTDFAVNEGGGTPLMSENGGLVYPFPIGEKGRMELTFSFSGRSGHAAHPWRADNALYRIAEVLKRLKNYQSNAEVNVGVPIFKNLRLFGVQEEVEADNADKVIDRIEKNNKRLASALRGMSRISITPTIAKAGAKSNSIPAAATLTCDVRTLPYQNEGYVKREIDKLIEGIEGIDGVSYKLEVWAYSNSSPSEGWFVDQMKLATEEVLGTGIQMVPELTIGFTDSRCVRPLGTLAYGFSPLSPKTDTTRSGVHGINESMDIENLVFRTKVQIALAYHVLQGKAELSV